MSVAVESIEAVRELVRDSERLLPAGAGTKPALSTPAESGVTTLDLSGLSGLTYYDGSELTFTALAGTPLAEIEDTLGEQGQYLPFDPPFRESGATLGGTIAAGASGPGGYGSGRVRDFVIGVRIVDGAGRLIRGGGRVVKNAAGFDLPKLMVGSIGRLGVIVEASCKVFPRPVGAATLRFGLGGLAEALAALVDLAGSPLHLDALELHPRGQLIVRITGSPESLDARVARVAELVGREAERLSPSAAGDLWREAAEFNWVPAESRAVAVPITPPAVPGLDSDLESLRAPRRYGLGANIAWIAWPEGRELVELDELLRSRERGGVVLTGPPISSPILGRPTGGAFGERVRRALDPDSRFPAGVA